MNKIREAMCLGLNCKWVEKKTYAQLNYNWICSTFEKKNDAREPCACVDV